MDIATRIATLCAGAITAQTFPGCVVGYIREGETVIKGFGRQRYEGSGSPVDSDTIYDVASITKSVVTGSVAMKMVEEGRLNLDDAVAQYVPELTTKYREDIRVRHLLTYTLAFQIEGGLAAIAKRAPDRVFEEMCKTELVSAPGEQYYYTNGPAMLLTAIIERSTHEPLDVLARRYFFEPLGMTLSTMHPELLPRFQIAPTEIDWRGEVRAEVHDEAAWAMAQHGRIAGDAGLFTTAGDLLKFCQMLIDEGWVGSKLLLTRETVALMHTNQLNITGEDAGFGWELGWNKAFGDVVSPQAFGKTGFTGCVIVIDPTKKAAMVHLSNRTYPKRPTSREPIINFRRALAQIVFSELPDQQDLS